MGQARRMKPIPLNLSLCNQESVSFNSTTSGLMSKFNGEVESNFRVCVQAFEEKCIYPENYHPLIHQIIGQRIWNWGHHMIPRYEPC